MATKKDELLTRASDIAAMVPYWHLVNSIVQGLTAMKLGGNDFLPMFPDEASKDYQYRLSLAKFTNIYRDVVEALSSKPFEEEVKLISEKPPQDLLDFIENVDGSSSNLTQFSALTFFNGINNAIDWIFVDYPKTEAGKVYSVAETKEKNIKPFWSHVLATNVYEVRTEIIGAKEVISYFRMFEPKTDVTKDRVREFKRDKETGKVTWILWEEITLPNNTTDYVPIDGGTLGIDMIPMVPFVTGRRDGKTFKFYPAMQDAADLQITLYQNESAQEYTTAMTCYPMLAAIGMKAPLAEDGKTPMKLAVGPNRTLYAPSDGMGNQSDWKFVEPNANSMEFVQKKIAQTKQDLREIGRQPLTALSTQLTTTTTAIAAGKAKSAVTFWALSLKDTLEQALHITMLWMKISYEPEVNVYTGFDDILDEGKDLDTLDSARDRNDISRQTYLAELQRRGVLSPEFNYDSEMKRILEEIPTGPDNPENDVGTSTNTKTKKKPAKAG